MEAFDAYCAQVQGRLAEHAAQRRDFLQAAYDRLTRLLQTAKAVEDTALYGELWQYRVAARELLDVLAQGPGLAGANPTNAPIASAYASPSLASAPSALAPAASSPSASSPALASNGVAPPPAAFAPPAGPWPAVAPPAKPVPLESNAPTGDGDLRANVSPAQNGYVAPEPPIVRIPRRPMRPLVDIEADAVRLRGDLVGWNDRWPLRDHADILNAPNCLRLRAVACRQRRLEEEAGDTEVEEVTFLYNDVLALLDDAGDEEYTVALDDDINPRPTAYQWGELAERYEETAEAQAAFEWWHRHHAELSVADIQPLAEAVAAVQQRFNRLLFRVGARDPFQQQLFDDLRTWAREAQCYLQSLRPKVPMAELVESAVTLQAAWEQARIPVSALEERHQVVEDVIAMVNDEDFGSHPEADETRLREAVLACKNRRIPASDRRLRDALLPWAAMLEGDENFRDVLREINLEWERRQEAGKAEEIEEEPETALDLMSAELAAVREVTRGKRCLLLGGTCREENRRKIEQALELSELVWPSTKPSDPLNKFDTEIRHSDIVALLTRFSRKEWKNAQDICAQTGKRFVHLTSGYGVSQVVRHFYTQISPEGAAHTN